MAIETKLLVAAPMLQDYLVDNATGGPMSNGTITLYQDTSRTTLKNWYYQSGSPNNYTYIALPNPLTLSGIGTIADPNGNDTIPFFYPFSETNPNVSQPYYIVVANSNGQQQFVRQNFPFIGQNSVTPGETNVTNKNLIVNNVFWRNIGSLNAQTLANNISLNIAGSATTYYYATLAPSQHDGYIMPDIEYFKNSNGSETTTISFIPFVAPSTGAFPDQVLPQDVTPEFYLNYNCTGAGSETNKYIQVPLALHLKSLSGRRPTTLVLNAMAVTGNPIITVSLFRFLGTGVSSPQPFIPADGTITLTNNWQSYQISLAIPSSQNLSLGSGGDDAFYMLINFPVGVGSTCNINIAKPAFYLSSPANAPTNDFDTYDLVNSVTSSPRTGDVRTSLNSFAPFGWVPMNDGTVGNATSNSTTRANIDTWPVFNLIWNYFKPYNNATTNSIAQMKTSAGSNVGYGATAIADFSANNQLALTKMLGRVMIGTVPVSSFLPDTYSQTFTASNDGGAHILISPDSGNVVPFYKGQPIVFSNTGGALPTNLNSTDVFYISDDRPFIPNAFYVSTSYSNALNSIYVAFVDAGSGTNTFITSLQGTYLGEYAHTQLVAELAAHTHTPTTGGASFIVSTGGALDFVGGGHAVGNATTGTTGSSTPFNIVQPSVSMNIFMKL